MNEPEKARALSEALTRDADSPATCSYEEVPVMVPSRLAQLTLHADARPNGVDTGGNVCSLALLAACFRVPAMALKQAPRPGCY